MLNKNRVVGSAYPYPDPVFEWSRVRVHPEGIHPEGHP